MFKEDAQPLDPWFQDIMDNYLLSYMTRDLFTVFNQQRIPQVLLKTYLESLQDVTVQKLDNGHKYTTALCQDKIAAT